MIDERRHDPAPDDLGVLVRERPVGNLQREVYGDRLAAVADLIAAVDVEDARLAQLGCPGLEGRVDKSSCLDFLGDDDGDGSAAGR